MLEIITALIGFIFAIGLLTTVHEYGHFWVARKLGIKVLRFSIGFGNPLLRWYDKSGTEYAIAPIPLGGYVKMLDESEGAVSTNERHLAFNNKSVGVRMAVICAGPLFNILFAVIAYWLVFMLGVSSMIPVLGTVPKGTIADLAGLKRGQEIVKVDGRETKTWEDIAVAFMPHIGEKGFIDLETYDKKTDLQKSHVLNLTAWSLDDNEENLLQTLGLEPLDPILPIIGKVLPDYPASEVGLVANDLIKSVNGIPVSTRSEVTNFLRTKGEQVVIIDIERASELLSFRIIPAKKLLEGGEEVGFIGIQYQAKPWPVELIRVQRYGPWQSLLLAVDKTKVYTILTLQFLHKMIVGKVSLHHVAGPISIAKYAGETVTNGVEYFLGFLGLISISLGVLNMMPIPILDGGHFLYCLIELVNGKPISERLQDIGRTFGIVFLVTLMMLALYNDIMRL